MMMTSIILLKILDQSIHLIQIYFNSKILLQGKKLKIINKLAKA
jgi:hypothetical protein